MKVRERCGEPLTGCERVGGGSPTGKRASKGGDPRGESEGEVSGESGPPENFPSPLCVAHLSGRPADLYERATAERMAQCAQRQQQQQHQQGSSTVAVALAAVAATTIATAAAVAQ